MSTNPLTIGTTRTNNITTYSLYYNNTLIDTYTEWSKVLLDYHNYCNKLPLLAKVF